MKDLKWLINRLRAMNGKEVVWRLQQKTLERKEREQYGRKVTSVVDLPLSKELIGLHPEVDRIKLNWENTEYSIFRKLDLLGDFSYFKYEKKWNAGFQTEASWSETDFSYDINCSQRVDIGDIRTNWELNRHFQFSALAKSYYVTGDKSYYEKLKELFMDWNEHNAFLRGVEWTSAMEVAIRVNSWVFTYCFLKKAFDKYGEMDMEFLEQLSHGILAMTDYITKHYSRFSSANNHLIVEAYAIGVAGIFFDYKEWITLSIKILTEEIGRQNEKDGVNREMSLHYQSFVMEAYGTLILFMRQNRVEVPSSWQQYLEPMSEFLADCCGNYGETIVFGDNDEGKILDLDGRDFNHYQYVLQLMSCVWKEKYTDMEEVHENLYWLVGKQGIHRAKEKSKYVKAKAKCYQQGGYTLLRSNDERILIGMDHADLGFGSIAAHGHADALSFQLYLDGEPIFTDAGTFNYHITPADRDLYRSSTFHNTVTVNKMNQSEMLGPFLWGKRAETKLIEYSATSECACVTAQTSYQGITHVRKLTFNYQDKLVVEDTITGDYEQAKVEQHFLLGPELKVKQEQDKITCQLENGKTLTIQSDGQTKYEIGQYSYSESYSRKENAKKISCFQIGSKSLYMKTEITID